MAKVTFDDLKAEVAMKTEETGSLPSTVVVSGVQYMIQLPAEAKLAAMSALRNPGKLDDLLDQAHFAGTDGSDLHA